MEVQFKSIHNYVDIVDRPKKNVSLILLQYNMDKPVRSYAQVRMFERKKEDEKFQQRNCMKQKLDEDIYLLDVKSSADDESHNIQHICDVI